MAQRLRERLGATVVTLRDAGFSQDEAIGFIEGVAFGLACEHGETWTDISGCRRTFRNLMSGGCAKAWSISSIHQAIDEIAVVL